MIARPKPAMDEAWLDRWCRADDSARPSASVELDLHRSFQWHDRFLVGHPDIDADHRRFFAYLADGAAAESGPAGTLARVALVMAMVDDLHRHLETEERILDGIGATLAADHRSGHRALRELAGAALAIGSDGEWATALRLLSVAVLEHIVLDDAKLRPCLAVAACLHPAAATPSGRVLWPGH